MTKLYKNKKIILKNLKNLSIKKSGLGLMFSNKKKCENGVILNFPKKFKSKKFYSITMLFCFFPLDIIFVNSKNIIVDKTTMSPFQLNYTPKKKCDFVIETLKNGFSNLKIGDKIKVKI
jgi:uncharacterized membrane protein (UPF0127 family)